MVARVVPGLVTIDSGPASRGAENNFTLRGLRTADGPAETLPRLPDFCRVTLSLHPAPGSDVRVEVWLPRAWNGRYLQAGNGGFAGSIAYAGLANAVRHGFAVANSDGGHRSVGADARWGMNAPDKIEDFGNRAIQATAAAAKAIVEAYYAKPANRSYFSGCSDGGRESLMAAQRYPQEFDGWLVGAPENDFTALVRWVETGSPPKQVIATKFRGDDPAKGVSRARPLCPYPQQARYRGTGSPEVASNFQCR